ncbi:MAG: hypothetical protein ABR508_04475 [Candidatus Baltobacteraceae bacterium]
MKRFLAGTALAAVMAAGMPAAPALADGAASTRNILLGAGAAAYLIIQHNRKVHERYAEDARRQATLQSENNDAWAAYSSEKSAYQNSLAEIVDLKREVGYQHNVIVQQRQQLAMAQRSGYAVHTAYAPAPRRASARKQGRRVAAARAKSADVAIVSYGWGEL